MEPSGQEKAAEGGARAAGSTQYFGVRGSISNVDRTEPLSFLSTLRALGITSRANLEKIRKVTAKRAFEAHDLLLRSYYAAKSSPPRTDFSGIMGNAFAFQHCLRPSKYRHH